MKVYLLTGLFVLVIALLVPYRGVTDPSPTGTTPGVPLEDEPITGEPAEPNPGDEEAPPHTGPYGTGGPAAEIPYEQLSPGERATADAGRNTTGWESIHATYSAGAHHVASESAADTAARRLGVRKLANLGVVP
jgi:hypothetical protein